MGSRQNIKSNTSEQMPYGVCNHVAFKGPFTSTGKGEDVRLCVPVGDKWELDEHAIPTEKNLPITDYDLQYKNGTMVTAPFFKRLSKYKWSMN